MSSQSIGDGWVVVAGEPRLGVLTRIVVTVRPDPEHVEKTTITFEM